MNVVLKHMADAIQDLKTMWDYTKVGNIKRAWQYFASPTEGSGIMQFGKYGVCGVLSVVVLTIAWLFFSKWFPSELSSGLSDSVRAKNTLIANLLAFPISNIFAYITNVLFVFESGRHSRWMEFVMFSSVSLFSFLVGLLCGPLLIQMFGIPSWLSQIGLVVTSALVNFACRKFFIFKG